MRIVYLVTKGEYSDYAFLAAFELDADAEAYAARHGGPCEAAYVEPLELYGPGEHPWLEREGQQSA